MGIDKFDVANGKGIGVVLWVSGCSVGCPGCHNPECWSPKAGEFFDGQAKQEIFRALKNPYVTRFTLSGGHPFEFYNIRECGELLQEIKEKFPNIQTWGYSGYYFEDLIGRGKPINPFIPEIFMTEVLPYLDILVDGPYKEDRRDISLPFRGSTNQSIIELK